ncbi:MAG TPA: UDP-N-acetylmuramate dehydrogenase [Mariprofundaceae bacterium]|nr:UDP-N-acetylmuramate dehydrogenase [Mariprofundaceae bacterium]
MAALKSAAWHDELARLGHLVEHEPMARHTTLGVGGPARWFFRPASRAAMIEAMPLIPADLPRLPLGRGSNLLVHDAGFDGIVIDLGGLDHIEVNGCSLTAEAGARMSRVARICAESGLSGLEFLSTVPGDMGGGVAMNAGAFGQEIADTFDHADVLTPDGKVVRLAKAALTMTYRHTELPAGSLVLAAGFTLHPASPEQIRERIRGMREKRGRTQPLAQPNFGSVFKNPPGDYSARLVEAAGLKGFGIGGARISALHANFIVNEGSATCADVQALIKKAQDEVEAKFGIRLQPEVRMIGGKP